MAGLSLATLSGAAANQRTPSCLQVQLLLSDMLICSWGDCRNAPFAAAYDIAVPLTWHVINDQDTICWCVLLHTCWLYLMLHRTATFACKESKRLLCYNMQTVVKVY